MRTLEIRTRHWTRKEYDRLVELGLLDEDEPIELVDGQMVVREPKHTPHTTATELTAEALRRAFGIGWHVRVQEPVALDDDSEPEPDVTVVRGAPRDYLRTHPSRPALVVEIAKASLAFDRRRKGGLYARAGILEYWIVNLVDRALEVYRQPVRSRSARYGWKYKTVRMLKPGASVAPVAALAAARVAVADLLP
jgi:Uma2 family endonuclease